MGVDADGGVDDELDSGEPDTGVGDAAKTEGPPWIAYIHHNLGGERGQGDLIPLGHGVS